MRLRSHDVGFLQDSERSVHDLSIMDIGYRRIAFGLAGLSFLSIGILQLYAGEILVGRPAFALAGERYGSILVWIVGSLLIANGLLGLMRQSIPIVSGITATFIICYCVFPNLWILLNGDTGIALTNFGKGVVLATGVLVLRGAASSEWDTRKSQIVLGACNYALGFFLTASGVQHFIFASFVATLIPSWIPLPQFWVYATGCLLVVCGLCIVSGFKRKIALHFSAWMIFSWVLIVHGPRALFTVQDINEWTALFEALTFSSLLFIVSRAAFIENKFINRDFIRAKVTDL